MRASKVFDDIIKGLHQRRIWTVGWITFGLQHNWGTLKDPANYEPLMRYFMARYGAYYNYFMWSPTWELADMGPEQGDLAWESNLNAMMGYLVSIDPSQPTRLQGVHDQARTYWEGWQTILPRQQPSRSIVGPTTTTGPPALPIVNGNTRLAEVNNSAGWDSGLSYPSVIIGAEDIWEFCSGNYGKPINATEVRRGLVGGLFARILPMYDELVEFDPPLPASGHACNQPGAPGFAGVPGLGNGSGEGYYKGMLDWWYTNVRYRDASFSMLNHLTMGTPREIISGIHGQEYVLYREDAGNIGINLTGVPSSSVFDVWAIDAVYGTIVYVGTVNGGVPLSAPSPFPRDTLVFLRKR